MPGGRPRSRTLIVPEAVILSTAQILTEQWILADLFPVLQSDISCIEWLASRRLIHNSFLCPRCNNHGRLNTYKQHVDGHRWMCNQCNVSRSVRYGSFFTKSHLSMRTLVQMIYAWQKNDLQADIASETRTNVNTIMDWCNFLRDICCCWVDEHAKPIGGITLDLQPVVVEIDESCFFRR
jgi:transposase-like protein